MDTKKKLLKTVKIVAIASKVCTICLLVACAFALFALIWNLAVGLDEAILANIKILTPIYNETGLTSLEFNIATTYLLLTCAISAVLFTVVRKLFCEIEKAGTPFIEQSPKQIKLIALMLLLLFTVPQAVSSLVAVAFGASSSAISTEGTSLLIVLVVYALALVFEYGVELQKADDQTL